MSGAGPSPSGRDAVTGLRPAIVLITLFAAGCTPPPDPNDAPQTHTGRCTHYGSALRELEDVPNCELRTRDTLINGLSPAYPGNKS